MSEKGVSVPVHDIAYKMDDVLAELREVQRIAVDPEAVARTIEQVTNIRRAVAEICCNERFNCDFEVVNQELRKAG